MKKPLLCGTALHPSSSSTEYTIANEDGGWWGMFANFTAKNLVANGPACHHISRRCPGHIALSSRIRSCNPPYPQPHSMFFPQPSATNKHSALYLMWDICGNPLRFLRRTSQGLQHIHLPTLPARSQCPQDRVLRLQLPALERRTVNLQRQTEVSQCAPL